MRVKIEMIKDQHRFKQSSCGVQFFTCEKLLINQFHFLFRGQMLYCDWLSDDLFDPSTVSVTSPLHHRGNWHRTSSSDSDG